MEGRGGICIGSACLLHVAISCMKSEQARLGVPPSGAARKKKNESVPNFKKIKIFMRRYTKLQTQ